MVIIIMGIIEKVWICFMYFMLFKLGNIIFRIIVFGLFFLIYDIIVLLLVMWWVVKLDVLKNNSICFVIFKLFLMINICDIFIFVLYFLLFLIVF